VDDLNRNNPLGTRGELAIQFASLLGELWTTAGGSKDFGSRFSGSAVYPRAFKQTLGRHAEQFVGYDQHDSQELAIYLLDALHEDTNRVTNKPYVEKPEKEDNQSDEDASQKAWELHLKRDDSKVQSFFMGQVKSRVQCCKPECGRVSTTFEPCMYLSVPIPGSLEKSVDVTFVPLDPSRRPRRVPLTLSKSGSFKDLLVKLLIELKSHSIVGPEESIELEDLCAVDVFQHSFYRWYNADDPIDLVRENDKTFVYQLLPVSDDQKSEAQGTENGFRVDISHLNLREWEPQQKRFKLDDSTREKLDCGDGWMQQFTKYLRDSNNLNFERAFNPSRGSSLARAEWYNKTQRYLSLTNKTLLKSDTVSNAGDDLCLNVSGESTKTPIDGLCSTSPTFEDVNSTYDVAVLDFCLEKMRDTIVRLEQPKPEIPNEGVVIEIRLRNAGTFSAKDVSVPFALRIPPDMTVYQLRERLAKILHRCLRTGRSAEPANLMSASAAMATVEASAGGAWSGDFGSAELYIIRQVPLAYERKTPSSSARSHTFSSSMQLGSLGKEARSDGRTSLNIASPKDEAENALVARLVGDHGSVIMDWPEVLFEQHFNLGEYETVDQLVDPDEPQSKSSISVMDCIAKYCQMEQLEESDMWYCNRCREHVQAWKNVDLYLAPPILFIHLKRFHFSASTHRRDKIGAFIDFPLKGLDLTERVSHWTDEEKPIYDCFAVSNHFGGLGGGHYTAYCLNDDGSWAYYDDSRVTTNVDPKDVVSPAAYCLYYRRRDVQSGEEFAINLQTPSIHAPIIIPDALYGHNSPHDDCEISSTNAAMVDDEDGMELDDVDNASRSTSPMGSIEDHIEREHLDDNDTASDCPLLQ
jgi:ubiquitin C-terminal hydrolase